jgi:hypothetical protein
MNASKNVNYTGGCACGAIRYKIAADPVMAFHCQCRDCQKATGSGHASALVFPRPAVEVTGSPKFHETPADSGNIGRRGFCTSCGSLVLGGSSGVPDLLCVFAGSLDDPSRFAPQAVLYHSRAQPWDIVDPALTTFPAMPPLPT